MSEVSAKHTDLARLASLVELGELDVTEGDALLLTQRDKLQRTLEREELHARDVVAISAELRAVHEKLLDVAKRRRNAFSVAHVRAGHK
jgi:hypothetical protein